jgi:hypothetical protein
MGVTKKLMQLLAEETQGNPLLAEALEKVFKKCNIKLIVEIAKETGKKRNFIERVKKSRMTRPDYLHIAEHYQEFLAPLKEMVISESQQEKVAKIEKVWCTYYRLLTLAVHSRSKSQKQSG